MEYVIIGVCIIVAIAIGIALYLKNKQNKNEPANTTIVVSKPSSGELQTFEVSNEIVIQMELLPAEAIPDETKLVEIYSKHYLELRVSASQIPWDVDDGIRTMLPFMQSDIHLQKDNTVLIIDAKYYSHTTQTQYDKHTLHSNNMYQFFMLRIEIMSLEKMSIKFQEYFCMQKQKKKYSRTMYIRCMEIR